MKQLLLIWKIGRAVVEECLRLGINIKSIPIDTLIRIIKDSLKTNKTVTELARAAKAESDYPSA